MAVPAKIMMSGAVSSLPEFQKYAKLGMKFSGAEEVSQVMDTIWNMCKQAPTAKDTPFSEVFIHTGIAKEFDSENLSDWAKALDETMAVACCMAVRDLKLHMQEHGKDKLTWDKVLSIFNNCDYIVKDDKSSKRINNSKTFDETSFLPYFAGVNLARKSEIKTWFHRLFNEHNEQAVVKNSVIAQEETLDRLAGIAAECGAAIKDPVTFFAASDEKSDKVMEIGVIRFPKKGDAHIKLFRLVVFAFFKSSRILLGQRDQAGFEVEYDSIVFRPNADAIDTKFAGKARAKLADEETFNF